jgi:UDP-N-acetyl-D-galactosamine dehydrogenase
MQEFLNSKNSTNKRRLLVLGLTFKENCPDVRNSKVFDIIGNLSSKDFLIDAYDPWIDEHSVKTKYPINLIKDLKEDSYDGIIIAVPHDAFYELGIEKIKSYGKKESIIFDLKSLFESKYSDFRL